MINYTEEEKEKLRKRDTVMLNIATMNGVIDILDGEQLKVLMKVALSYARCDVDDVSKLILELIKDMEFKDKVEQEIFVCKVQLAYTNIQRMIDGYNISYLDKCRKAKENISSRWNC